MHKERIEHAARLLLCGSVWGWVEGLTMEIVDSALLWATVLLERLDLLWSGEQRKIGDVESDLGQFRYQVLGAGLRERGDERGC